MQKSFGKVRTIANAEGYFYAGGATVESVTSEIETKTAKRDELLRQASELEIAGADWINDAQRTSKCPSSKGSRRNKCLADNQMKIDKGNAYLNDASAKRHLANELTKEINDLLEQKDALIASQIEADRIKAEAERDSIITLAQQGLTQESSATLAKAQAETMIKSQESASKSNRRIIIAIIVVGVSLTLMTVILRFRRSKSNKNKIKQDIA